MQRIWNQKMIKNLCGTVSYKRGVSYYQMKKVSIHEHNGEFVKATVFGTEDFRVRIDMRAGKLHTSCSCQANFDFNKSCQHVAAVLVALMEMEQETELAYKNEKESLVHRELTKQKPLIKVGINFILKSERFFQFRLS